MNDVLISIIIPVYNVEKYLRVCIDSVINQTYKNIEIILVDDKSPDSSSAICDEYLKKDRRIKVVHKEENEGLGFARNTGLNVARGIYVGFVDSDDYLNANAVEVLYKAIVDYKLDHSKACFCRVNDSLQGYQYNHYELEKFYGKSVIYEYFPRLLGSCPERHDVIEMSVWGALYNMQIIKSNNICFESEHRVISEDLCFNMEYCKYSQGVAVIPQVVYNYRVNGCSLTQKYSKDRFLRICDFHREIINRLQSLNFSKEVYYRKDRMFFVNMKGCLFMEIYHSKKSLKERYINFCSIINNPVTRSIIDDYPIIRMQMPQRIFLFLIKWHMARTIFILMMLKRI